MNWNREVSKNLEHTKIGIKDWRDTAERRHVLKQARRWARWQRDQLRSNEAIERAAESMFEADWEDEDDFAQIGRSSFANLHKEGREYYRDRAKGTITALLGED